MTPPVPPAIGPFLIRRVMGRGGMGVVYEAVHRDTGERVALKTVRLVDTGMLTSLRREIHALSRVHHPGIVGIAAHGMDDGLPWYAMSFLEGPTLRLLLLGAGVPTASATAPAAVSTAAYLIGSGAPTERLTARDPGAAPDAPPARVDPALSLPRALLVARRLCAALSYLHGEGIVHRDLKPDNVFVLPGDRPVIVDFGLAGTFAGATGRESVEGTGEASGTARYMAPEQARGDPVDARADIYALGCILYELLTGDPPFSAGDAHALLRLHATAEPEPPSHRNPTLPTGVDELTLRLLAKDPAARIGHADTVARLLAELGAPDEPAPVAARSYLYRPRLAGRAAELARLREAFARAADGGGVVAGIGGESGIGKTRLALELASAAKRRGGRVVTGDCSVLEEGAATAPLVPLARLLIGIADRCREMGPDAADRLLGSRAMVLAPYEPAIARFAEARRLPSPAELPPHEARLRLYEDLLATIREHAREAPILLLIDDAQWADEMTLGFLTWLLCGRRLERFPLMVVITYRGEEIGAFLPELLDAPGFLDVTLGRLSEESSAGIVSDMLAWPDPSPGLCAALHRHSEGNPFFVAELLRAAVAEGILWKDQEGGWMTAGGAERYDALPLPRTLSELSGRRLARLSPQATALARAAATLGRQMSLGPLARTLGVAEGDLFPALAELFARHVLEDAEDGGVRFVHDKIRETAYQMIPAGERAPLHAGAAEALAGDASRAEEAARHWELAGRADRAMAAYLVAARDAHARYAHAEAVRAYRSFLALAPEGGERLAARLRLAELLAFTGQAEGHARESLAALHEARQLGARSQLGHALREVARVRRREGRLEEGSQHLGEALGLFLAEGDLAAAGLARGELATTLEEQGRMPEAGAMYRQALDEIRTIGAGQALGQTLLAYGGHLRHAGLRTEAHATFEQALHELRAAGDRRGEAMALGGLANIRLDRGDLEGTRVRYEAAHAIFHEVGDRRGVATCLMNEGSLAIFQGRMEAARELIAAAERTFLEIAELRALPQLLTNKAEMLQRLGLDREAFEANEEALAMAQRHGDSRRETAALSRRGQLLIKRGDKEPGRVCLLEAIARHVAARELGPAAVDFECLADVDLAEGRLEDAWAHAAEARSAYRAAEQPGLEAGALLTLARIERKGFGNYAAAEALLAEALGLMGREVDDEITLTHLCEEAHLALARGLPADAPFRAAERLFGGSEPGPDSTSSLVMKYLRLAMAEAATGRPLLHGDAVAAFDEPLLRRLRADGRAEAPPGAGSAVP